PGARGQLEVFGDAAVEHQALLGTALIEEAHGIADPVEPFIVEMLRRELRLPPVTRGDERATHAHFALPATWNELELAAGDGQADDTGRWRREVAVRRERCGLGGSPARSENDRISGGI